MRLAILSGKENVRIKILFPERKEPVQGDRWAAPKREFLQERSSKFGPVEKIGVHSIFQKRDTLLYFDTKKITCRPYRITLRSPGDMMHDLIRKIHRFSPPILGFGLESMQLLHIALFLEPPGELSVDLPFDVLEESNGIDRGIFLDVKKN